MNKREQKSRTPAIPDLEFTGRPTVMVNSRLEIGGPTCFFSGMFAGALSVGIPQNGHVRSPLDSHRPVGTLAFHVVFYMGVAVSEPSFRSSGVVCVSHALTPRNSELEFPRFSSWKMRKIEGRRNEIRVL